ncbi:hypothetical protein ACQCVP_02220 [Rossellomorea vietnamensis]
MPVGAEQGASTFYTGEAEGGSPHASRSHASGVEITLPFLGLLEVCTSKQNPLA